MDKTDILVSAENRHFSSNNTSSTITSSSLNNREYDMNDLITDAQSTFNNMINTQIIKMLKNAKGVAFIKMCKGGSGVGDFKGRGIVMKHNVSDDEWGGPCAINVCGNSEAEIGVNEVCTVFIINDENFFSNLLQNNRNNDIMAGNEFSITPGKLDDNNWSSSKIVSFSFAKGVFVDLPWEKIKITINDNCNHHYYQNEINPDVIFSGNIKSFDNQFFELSRRLIDTVNNISSGLHFGQGKSPKRYQFNMNAPLYQYYVESNKNDFTLQQLKQLPALPYLGDIRLRKYTLAHVKSWIVGNKAYRQFKDFIRAKKFTIKHDDSKNAEIKYMFNENAPLYQYYTSKKSVEYNVQQLHALPQFPFLYDIQHYHNYNFLTKINPMNWWVYAKDTNVNPAKWWANTKDTNVNPVNWWASNKDTNVNPANWWANAKDTNMNPANLISNLKGKMQSKSGKIPSQKYVFNEMAPLYQYYIHGETEKDKVYTRETLSKLPQFPFSDDITSNKIRFKQYNPINIVKKSLKLPKFLQKKRENKLTGFIFNENIPMVQYYIKNEKDKDCMMVEGVYNHQQLGALPKLPYLKDIHSPKVTLMSYNPVSFVKRFYKKYVGGNKQ